MEDMFLSTLVPALDPGVGTDEFFSWQFLQVVARNLTPGVGPALVSLGATVLLTPLTIWAARRTGFLSHPDRARDIHTRPIAYGGGIAMFGAFALACLVFLR